MSKNVPMVGLKVVKDVSIFVWSGVDAQDTEHWESLKLNELLVV